MLSVKCSYSASQCINNNKKKKHKKKQKKNNIQS